MWNKKYFVKVADIVHIICLMVGWGGVASFWWGITSSHPDLCNIQEPLTSVFNWSYNIRIHSILGVNTQLHDTDCINGRKCHWSDAFWEKSLFLILIWFEPPIFSHFDLTWAGNMPLFVTKCDQLDLIGLVTSHLSLISRINFEDFLFF